MPKEKTFVECGCGMDVFGFSEKHARQNLFTHKTVSKKHKQFLELKKKWMKSIKK